MAYPTREELPGSREGPNFEQKQKCQHYGRQTEACQDLAQSRPELPRQRAKANPIFTLSLLSRRQGRETLSEDIAEHEVQKRLHNRRAERAARREEMVNKLMQLSSRHLCIYIHPINIVHMRVSRGRVEQHEDGHLRQHQRVQDGIRRP